MKLLKGILFTIGTIFGTLALLKLLKVPYISSYFGFAVLGIGIGLAISVCFSVVDRYIRNEFWKQRMGDIVLASLMYFTTSPVAPNPALAFVILVATVSTAFWLTEKIV
jgi:hypothetical protein